MPEKKTIRAARRMKREGKRPTTQAGAFVAEEMRHAKKRKHGARSVKQLIAIGLSKARRAGIKLPKPKGKAAREQAARAEARAGRKVSPTRSRATLGALKREPCPTCGRRPLRRRTTR